MRDSFPTYAITAAAVAALSTFLRRRFPATTREDATEQAPPGVERTDDATTHPHGRVESVFGRRCAILATIIFWGFTAYALLHSSEVFFDPKQGAAVHGFMIAVTAAMAAAGPYLWFRYAKVIDVADRAILVRATPGGAARVHLRADVAELTEGSGRNTGELRIRFRDGTSVLVDRYFTKVAVLQRWLDRPV